MPTPNNATGVSKLNASVAVPTTPPTVTCTARITSYTLPSASHSLLMLAAHATDVADVQPAVKHTADTSCTVAVCSLRPKLSPLIVTGPGPHPLVTVLLPTPNDATGASKLNASVAVPTTPPTVTCTTRIAFFICFGSLTFQDLALLPSGRVASMSTSSPFSQHLPLGFSSAPVRDSPRRGRLL